MKKSLKILISFFTLFLVFTSFNITSAKAATDGEISAGDNVYWINVRSTKALYDSPTGGNQIGAIGPQQIYNDNVHQARLQVNTWLGAKWMHYTTGEEVYYDMRFIHWPQRTVDVVRTQNLYDTAYGSKASAIGAQNGVSLIKVAYQIDSYVGPAWLIY
ncbi:hypothetical protein WAZ07_25945 [Bacillus sp. FJAT-51639]|uniref:Uncharacterized protein n=1 Tax=Bacillus bruguierae TaxID=3127667 RepID=A0ABU8FPR7_9BACI